MLTYTRTLLMLTLLLMLLVLFVFPIYLYPKYFVSLLLWSCVACFRRKRANFEAHCRRPTYKMFVFLYVVVCVCVLISTLRLISLLVQFLWRINCVCSFSSSVWNNSTCVCVCTFRVYVRSTCVRVYVLVYVDVLYVRVTFSCPW